MNLRHFPARHAFSSHALCAAGSILLLLTMNGGSFEAISPIDGRYGYVMIGVSLSSCWSFGLSCSIQRFTPSRAWPPLWASLLVSLVWTLRPHLIVKWVPCSMSVPHGALTGCNFKLWVSLSAVSVLCYAFLGPEEKALLTWSSLL